ncbi:MAG: hypothetical protein AAGB34_02825 [Planctomycetota bacterium]
MISERLLAALGADSSHVEPIAHRKVRIAVDDVDRRYRDAIKSGAIPRDSNAYELLDPPTHIRVLLVRR